MKKEDTHVELHDTHTKIKKLMDEIRNLYNIHSCSQAQAAEARSSKPEAKSQKKPKARSQKKPKARNQMPEVRSQKPDAKASKKNAKK